MSDRELDRLPQVAIDYIESVIKNVRYRKKIRHEVRQELTAHFADTLHGCESEQERQKCAEALIAAFGDIKLLGTLIRRGKKRCRPLWRTLVVRAFQCAGIALILLVLYIGWFFSGKPIITTNYLEVMNQQVRPAADASQNAGPFYQEAVAHYVEPAAIKMPPAPSPEQMPGTPEILVDGQEQMFDTGVRPYASLTPQEQKVLAEWIAANRQSTDLVRQGNQKPYYWQTYSTDQNTTELIAVLLPHLAEFRKLSNLLCMKAIWQAQQGQLSESLATALDSYRFGTRLRNKNVLIEQLVAIAIEANAAETIRLLLADYSDQLDVSALSSVRNEFASIMGNEDFTIRFDGEKLFLRDEIQRSFTQTRIGGSHLYIQRIGQLGALVSDLDQADVLSQWFHILFTHPDREETLAAADRFYAAMDKFAKYSPAGLRQNNLDVTASLKEHINGNLLLELLSPALDKVIQLSYRNKANSEATLAIMAILEYKKKHDTLPVTLMDLVKDGLLQQVPIDPYSDQPLVYKKTAQGFTLYSVGTNFIDDGGIPAVTKEDKSRLWDNNRADTVFWPASK